MPYPDDQTLFEFNPDLAGSAQLPQADPTRSNAVSAQEANLIGSISPGSGLERMKYTQGSQVGVPIGSTGGIATFGVEPRPEPTPQPHQPPGILEAMGKGFLFGLAGLGREYAMNVYMQKNRTRMQEEAAQTAAYNKLLQSGIPISPKVGKALGLDPEEIQIGNSIAQTQAAATALNAQTFGQMFPGAVPGAGQGYGVLAGAPQGAPAAAPPAPPPGMPPAPPPGLGVGPTALTAPAAGPLTATPEMAPGPLLPGVQGTRLAPTSRDILTPPPPAGRPAAVAPAALRGPVDLATAARGLSTMSRGKMHGSLEVTPGVKITAERSSVDPADTFLGLAQAQGATPVAMSEAARAGGLPLTDQQRHSYGADWFAKNFMSILQRHQSQTGDPIEAQQGAYREAMTHGYLPEGMKAQILATQADVDKQFLGRIAMTQPEDFAVNERNWTAVTGANPSKEARERARQWAHDQLVAKFGAAPLRPGDETSPPLRANPAALAAALQMAGVATPDEEKLAREPAPIGTEAQQQLARANELQPLARGAGKIPPAGAQETGAQRAFREAEALKVEQGRKAAAAAVTGRDEALPGTTIPPDKLYHHVNPRDLTVPKYGTKYGEVQKADSPYTSFTGTAEQLSTTKRGRELVKTIGQQLDILEPLMKRGGWANIAARAGTSGLPGVKIPFTNLHFGIDAGSFSDEVAKKWIKESFKDMPDAEASKYAQAMVRLNVHTTQQALHVLRVFLDEKGQGFRGDLIEQGAKSLPSLTDNWLSASEKFKAMVGLMGDREQGFGLPGRSAWPFRFGPKFGIE